ncbi:hypothetical protein HYV89_05710 [Candidatus Woesearchaeota archaeon]|nr:hypothetical protein [Candidatus Woesearchaeota archaeon]
MLEKILEKSRRFILPVASVLTFSTGAFAEETSKEPAVQKDVKEKINYTNRNFLAGVSANFSFPVDPDNFKEQYNHAEFLGSLNGKVERIWRHFGYSMGASWSKYKIKKEYSKIGDGDLTFKSLNGGFSIYPALKGKVIPFISTDGGYFFGELSNPSPGTKKKESGLGFSFKAGMEIMENEGISTRVYTGYDRVFIGEGFGMFSFGLGFYLNQSR